MSIRYNIFMNRIKICIELNTQEYERLEELAIDIDPSRYLYKIVHKHLTGGINTTSDKSIVEQTHENRKKDSSIEQQVDEFNLLKKQLSYYGITQNTIADYLETSQSSVSYLFKTKNKNSHLYPRLFSKATSENIIYNMYVYKYTTLYNTFFEKNKQKLIEDWCEKELTNIDDDEANMYIVIIILASITYENFHGSFSVETFLRKLSGAVELVEKIELEQIKKKNIEYLKDKIDYIAPFLY